MYLHLGAEVNVRKREIVGIFDLDTASQTATTREFLKMAQRQGYLQSVNDELPKAFVLLQKEDGTQEVYFSQISASVLKKRTANQGKRSPFRIKEEPTWNIGKE